MRASHSLRINESRSPQVWLKISADQNAQPLVDDAKTQKGRTHAQRQNKRKEAAYRAGRIWFRHLLQTLMTGKANGAARENGANLISAQDPSDRASSQKSRDKCP